MELKLIIEFGEFQRAIKIIHRNLLPDTPIDKCHERILCEELSLIANLILNSEYYYEDEDDYFNECEYFDELKPFFENFFERRIFNKLNPKHFRNLSVIDTTGLTIVTFEGSIHVQHL